MKIISHQCEQLTIAELISDTILIKNVETGSQLMIDLYYQNFDGIIIYQKNIVDNFFDLKSGIAGDILQKFSNFRVKIAIIGNFEIYKSKSLNDFIFESNKIGNINFNNTLIEALGKFKK